MQALDSPFYRLRGVDISQSEIWGGLVSRRGVGVPDRNTVWASTVLKIIVDLKMILIFSYAYGNKLIIYINSTPQMIERSFLYGYRSIYTNIKTKNVT